MICENMCEEGSESKSSYEEGFKRLSDSGGADPRTNDLLTLMNCVQDFQHQ